MLYRARTIGRGCLSRNQPPALANADGCAQMTPSVGCLVNRSAALRAGLLWILGNLAWLFWVLGGFSGGGWSEGSMWQRAQAMLGIAGMLFGLGLCVRGVLRVIAEARLVRDGLPVEATVTAHRMVPLSLGLSPRGAGFAYREWVIDYRYVDHLGHVQKGRTGYLSPKDGKGWRKGETGLIHFDRGRPEQSVWIGPWSGSTSSTRTPQI
jgi:hypothetical protein